MPWIYHKNKIIFCCCFYCQYIHFWDMMHSFFWWRVWNSVFSLLSLYKFLRSDVIFLLLKRTNFVHSFPKCVGKASSLHKFWNSLFILASISLMFFTRIFLTVPTTIVGVIWFHSGNSKYIYCYDKNTWVEHG